jgi:hypothetical protein
MGPFLGRGFPRRRIGIRDAELDDGHDIKVEGPSAFTREGPMFRTATHRLTALAMIFVAMAVSPARTEAGLLKVEDASPSASVKIKYKNVGGDTATQQKTPNQNGLAQFSLGSLDDEKKIATVWVTKTPLGGGDPITYEIRLDPSGRTLASLEPFDVPTFTSASTSLVSVIDIETLLSQGNLFNVGQTLNITGGMIPQTSAITFKDGASLGSDPDLTSSLIDSLPNYSGSATVLGFDQFLVPEPSTLVLLGIGVLGPLLGARLKRAGIA